MGTTTSFDITQTAFLFNLIANSSSAAASPNAPAAQADLVWGAINGTKNLKQNPFPNTIYTGLLPAYGSQLCGGDWTLKWGPGVYQIDAASGRADNTAYVVYSASLNTYVVAIAGTDPKAFWDWISEDLQVGNDYCVNWTGYSPTGAKPTPQPKADWTVPQISMGTALGVWALGSQLTQSSMSPTPGVSLASYLTTLSTANSPTIIFTGHSLGGALSPTLANWTKAQLSGAKIIALPTAGPTPGNAQYQGAWDTSFPQLPVTNAGYAATNLGNQVGNFNGDVWNEDDVVPHAWEYIYDAIVGPLKSGDLNYFTLQTTFVDKVIPKFTLWTTLAQIQGGVEATALAATAATAQSAGAAADMTRAAYTIPFPTAWPISCIAAGGGGQQIVSQLQAPSGPLTVDQLLDYLANVHVWGYGTAAFGIDFSVFLALHPQPGQPT